MPALTPRTAIEVDSVAALCRMAAAGMGVAAVPRFLVETQLRDKLLNALAPGWDLMAAGVYIVWPSNVSSESLTRRLVDYLVEQMRPD